LRNLFVAAIMPLLLFATPRTVDATLPDIPRGVSVLNTIGDKALRPGILGNSDVDMISIQDDWITIQRDATTYDWTYIEDTIATVAGANKSALLRIPSMGGSTTNGGKTPDWVFDAMEVSHTFTDATPGITYTFVDTDLMTKCIPVFWQPTSSGANGYSSHIQ
jgi:hypothetical protein